MPERLQRVAQVALNGCMVYHFTYAVVYKGHSVVGEILSIAETLLLRSLAWLHYVTHILLRSLIHDMVLRGRIDEISG